MLHDGLGMMPGRAVRMSTGNPEWSESSQLCKFAKLDEQGAVGTSRLSCLRATSWRKQSQTAPRCIAFRQTQRKLNQDLQLNDVGWALRRTGLMTGSQAAAVGRLHFACSGSHCFNRVI